MLPRIDNLEIDYNLNATSLISCSLPRTAAGERLATVGRWLDSTGTAT